MRACVCVCVCVCVFCTLPLRYESLSRGYGLVSGQAPSSSAGGNSGVPRLVKAFHRVENAQSASQGAAAAGGAGFFDKGGESASDSLIGLADSPAGAGADGSGIMAATSANEPGSVAKDPFSSSQSALPVPPAPSSPALGLAAAAGGSGGLPTPPQGGGNVNDNANGAAAPLPDLLG